MSSKLLETVIEEMRDSLGRMPRPAELLERARSTKSPIHHYFEWNETKAANAYRLSQAAQYIREIRITTHSPEKKIVQVVSHQRSAPRVSEEAPRDIVREMLALARHELQQWSIRYSTLRNSKDLACIFHEIDLLINPRRADAPNQEKAHGPDHNAPRSRTSPTQAAPAQGGAAAAPQARSQAPGPYAARRGRYHRGRAA